MKLHKLLFIGLAGFLALFLLLAGAGLLLPSRFYVVRSLQVNANKALVYQKICNQQFLLSGGYKPAIHYSSRHDTLLALPEGPLSENTLSETPDSLRYSVVSSLPFTQISTIWDSGTHGTCNSDFTLSGNANTTNIRWQISGKVGLNPLSRWAALLSHRLLGHFMENALLGFKTQLHSDVLSGITDPILTDIPGQTLLVLPMHCLPANYTDTLHLAVEGLQKTVRSNYEISLSDPIVLFDEVSAGRIVFGAALVVEKKFPVPPPFQFRDKPSTKALQLGVYGPAKLQTLAWEKLLAEANLRHLQVAAPIFEILPPCPDDTSLCIHTLAILPVR